MDEARARELLQRDRDRIEHSLKELEGLNEGENEGLDQHPSDDAERIHGDELDATEKERLRTEIDAIERAEERLAAGTYGVSIESGDPIPDERLEAVPWAERTVEEQERFG
jgi:DnaK suppressor protein